MVWLKIEATRFACVDLKDFFYFFDGFGVRRYSYVTEKATRFIVNGGHRTDETAVVAEQPKSCRTSDDDATSREGVRQGG